MTSFRHFNRITPLLKIHGALLQSTTRASRNTIANLVLDSFIYVLFINQQIKAIPNIGVEAIVHAISQTLCRGR